MSNPVEPGEGADDLLGRWLAHHDKPADDGAEPTPLRAPSAPSAPRPSAARPSSAAVPQTRLSASAALAELRETTVDKHDGLGPVAPPSAFGVRRGQPGSAHSGPSGPPRRGADGEVAELDRPSPVGFEPVILRSVRNKSEPKKDDAERDKRGRLSRLRSRVSAPADPPASPADPALEQPVVSLHEQPTHFVPPPVFSTPPAAPAAPAAAAAPAERAARPVVPYPDVVALASAASLPVAEPDVEPEVEPEPEPVLPGPDTEPAPVVPEPEPEPEVEPVLPGPDTEPAPVPVPVPEPEPEPEPEPAPEPLLPGPDTPPSPLPSSHSALPEHQDDGEEPDVPTSLDLDAPKRRLVARTRRPETDVADDRKRRSRTPVTGTGTAGAARGLLAAARAATPPPAKAPAAVRTAPAPVPEVATLLPAEKPVETVPAVAPTQMPTVYEFAPRRSARRFLSMMLIVGLAVSAYLGYAAYESRETSKIGLAAIFILATLVIWAIRAGATVTRLTVRSGQLEIVRQGGRMVFDLTSTYTDIEVQGKPGSKKWKVVFLPPGASPAVVDSSMVDGRDFMRVLGFYRPDLAV